MPGKLRPSIQCADAGRWPRPAKVAERGFFDAVGVTRAPGGHIPDPPLLPDAEAMLVYSTGAMRDMTPYRTEREMFTPCY